MGNFFFIAGTPLQYDATEDGLSTSFSELPLAIDAASVSYLSSVFGSDLSIPVSVFRSDLTPFQCVIKYLKEKRGLTNGQVATVLGRDAKSIWVAYSKVKDKHLSSPRSDDVLIPAMVFSKDQGSSLESLVYFLKSNGFNFAKISRLIGKDQRTVWTAHARLSAKRGGEK